MNGLQQMFINRILNAMQQLEEIGGPDTAEYIEIMRFLKADIETRIINATELLRSEQYLEAARAALAKVSK